jgi:guanylate kinase
MEIENKNALLLVVSAPSGAGKSTLCNRLIDEFPGMAYSISCTTRAPRGEERNHEHYHFLSKEDFQQKVEQGLLMEYAEVHGNCYGTLKSTVEEALAAGHDLIMDIDVQGAAQVREACAKMAESDPVRAGFVDLFITPPSVEELRRRLVARATDATEVIETRLKNAAAEMAHRDVYRHVVVNDDLDHAFNELVEIVDAERARRR